ncbi:MAG: glycosyltransferase family 4 protein [Chitinophagaceae bacterium]|nr:glycosyltransferase family 4 protein [Chitinophagaceae bacterium]
MNIAFDAKRAYHNNTGLGQYSRTLIRLLASAFPQHEYFLYNPRKSAAYQLEGRNMHEMRPKGIPSSLFPSAWRSNWVKSDLKKHKINLYHGLSHEIPLGIENTGIPSIVTIHDLIHEKFPEQYTAIDVKIYSKKFRNACDNATRIIAISRQTKQDIMEIYKIPSSKIDICYQSCFQEFGQNFSEQTKDEVRSKFGLPKKFFLSVGSIIERKNLLNVCKAMFLLRQVVDIPLVVIGDGGKYKQKVQDFIRQHDLDNRVIFLSEKFPVTDTLRWSNIELPVIYQLATAMIYPSYYEGFGLPVLEALQSSLPVITSNVSCLPEAGGDAAYYVNPNSAEEIAEGMRLIYTDPELVDIMVDKGYRYASEFSLDRYGSRVMDIYKQVWK